MRGTGHTRRHRLTVVVIVASILALAALTVVSITRLRVQADRARHAQLILADLNAEAHHTSHVDWKATAQPGLSPALGEEFRAVRRRIDSLVRAYIREDPHDGRQLRPLTLAYLAAVDHELLLLRSWSPAASARVDELEVDPRFARLQARLALMDVADDRKSTRAAARTDLGIGATVLLGALGFIGLLWRLDRLRNAATRKRHRDLKAQALNDDLTGLPNRRKLQIDLETAVLRAEGGERWVLLLCDLDGFKTYNDTFGHLEGDLLLGRSAAKLARVVAPHGIAYRLGGDEFCALLRVGEAELPPVLAECHAALRESGTGFDVQASIGCVVLAEEAANASNALRVADQRMYAEKNRRDASARQQLRDLILRVIAEQDPELSDHVNNVARLSAGVGRRLGFDDAQVAALVRAAELHDVGKVAIPDSILHKPGALDPGEWEFMRRHTLIGESILDTAPALAGLGLLVRSSHERYDGTGYPDGLRGDEIPLASRVIFVCDCFHAMTTERPYASAMHEDDAVAELRRCAGTQFDPVVVDAFADELAAGHEARQRRVVA
jgi:diguanylate cyclase (GGDEF)-like protein